MDSSQGLFLVFVRERGERKGEGRREEDDVSFPKDSPPLLWSFDYSLRYHLQISEVMISAY